MENNETTTTPVAKKSRAQAGADTAVQTAAVVIGVYAGLYIVGTVNRQLAKFHTKKTLQAVAQES